MLLLLVFNDYGDYIILKPFYSLHFWFIVLVYIYGLMFMFTFKCRKFSIIYSSRIPGFGLLSAIRIERTSETLTMGWYNFCTTQDRRPYLCLWLLGRLKMDHEEFIHNSYSLSLICTLMTWSNIDFTSLLPYSVTECHKRQKMQAIFFKHVTIKNWNAVKINFQFNNTTFLHRNKSFIV